MASIIQILIHSQIFLEVFLNNSYQNKNSLTYLFYNFIDEIANSSVDKIEIYNFANEYNKINHKFNGYKGNNPMTFFNEFIKKLAEENDDNILKIYSGKKKIIFEGMSELDYEEDFIFNLVNLDNRHRKIADAMKKKVEFEDIENIQLKEEITIKPGILTINLEVENIYYNFEEEIEVEKTKYNLKAINSYNNYHSTA